MIKRFFGSKKRMVAVAVISAVLVGGLVAFWQTGYVVEAAMLNPIESPPETLFYDDFSGDLTQWTVISGTWYIENSELVGNSSISENFLLAGDANWTDYLLETKIFITNVEASLLIRSDLDAQNGYLIHFTTGNTDRIYKIIDGTYYMVASGLPPLTADQWYNVKVEAESNSISVYRDGVLSASYFDSTPFSEGKIGCRVYAGREGHYDEVKVTTNTDVPNAYNIGVNPERTKLIITCVWDGFGNLTIANLTTPTTIYYETNMSIYEKTAFSTESGNPVILNVRRAEFSFPMVTSSETWELYLNLEEVTSYTVSVEIS